MNTDAKVEVTIKKPTRVLHFSDGVDEEFEEEKACELKSELPAVNEVDPQTLPWGPWLSHYAWKSGNKMLNAVDYAGESLANLFGITTPKYQIEIDEHERLQAEKKRLDDESVGWVPKDAGGDIPLVLNEPSKQSSNH
ncbi:hypothetical protein evm_008336 [Chilo suppressalis]|nr:hypothetical protein evm_008336 [Chilo suppressalis]